MQTNKRIIHLFLIHVILTASLETNSQVILIPVPDSSIEVSDYDMSKAIYKYYKQQNQQTGLSSLNASSLQNQIFNLSKQNLSDPITIGLTFAALKGIIGNLEATIRTVSGDIAAHLTNLMANANAVAAHWESRLGDRLDRTIDQLNKTERRIVEDTEALIRMTQQTIRQVEAGAIESARIAGGEADIVAYNITSIIKRNKEARFVYEIPQKIRIGLNEPIVKVRGNFLGFKPYNFKLSGYTNEVAPLGFSANEVSIKLPDDFISGIQQETTVSLTAEPYSRRKRLLWFGYKYWRETPQTLTVVLKPKIDYSIAVSISPRAKLPTKHTFNYSFYDRDENCDADRRVDRMYVLPPTWFLNDATQKPVLTNTSGPNCGSGLIGGGIHNSGDNAVVVEGRIKGCGYDGVWPVRFCNGRGWWGYFINVESKSYQYQPLPILEQNVQVPNQSQRSFTFDYPNSNIPTDNQGIQFSYLITVLVQEGNATRKVEISDVNPNVEGFRTRMDNNRLSLEIDPMNKVLEIM